MNERTWIGLKAWDTYMGNGEGRNREGDMIYEQPKGCLPENLALLRFFYFSQFNIGDACDREAQEDAHPAIRRMLQEPTDISTRVEAPSSNAGCNSRTSTRFFMNLIKKQDRTMKELYDIMKKDFQEENFTIKEWIIYGVCAPIALILLCGLAELIEPTI